MLLIAPEGIEMRRIIEDQSWQSLLIAPEGIEMISFLRFE